VPDHGPGLHVALVGYGYAGKTFHAPLINATEGLDILVVTSSDAGKVHADLPSVDVVSDAKRAIDDARIDLVVIASPNATHAPNHFHLISPKHANSRSWQPAATGRFPSFTTVDGIATFLASRMRSSAEWSATSRTLNRTSTVFDPSHAIAGGSARASAADFGTTLARI
jgi:hypothetical protein